MLAHLFRIEFFNETGGTADVGEQNRHALAFAFHEASRCKHAIRNTIGRNYGSHWSGRLDACRLIEPRAAFFTKLCANPVAFTTLDATGGERRAAFIAKQRVRCIGILTFAANYFRLIRHPCVSSAIRATAQRDSAV